LLCNEKLFTIESMTPHTPVWKWILALVVLVLGAAVAVPLYRYADADDAPGGMVIAFLIFVVGGLVAMWIVNTRPVTRKPGSN
jgi:peptidoglycan/LPS O-acetylase OafA/YrhL